VLKAAERATKEQHDRLRSLREGLFSLHDRLKLGAPHADPCCCTKTCGYSRLLVIQSTLRFITIIIMIIIIILTLPPPRPAEMDLLLRDRVKVHQHILSKLSGIQLRLFAKMYVALRKSSQISRLLPKAIEKAGEHLEITVGE
jgi:hypothetical protein